MTNFEVLILVLGLLGIISGYTRPDLLPLPVLWGLTLILFFVLRNHF